MTLGFIFTFEQTGMAFWTRSPGPTWWDCMESLNPCIQPPYGLCNSNLLRRTHSSALGKGLHLIPLQAKHAEVMANFLKHHFTIYPRSRITLTKDRIYQGFARDQWIGVGIFTVEKHLVACCISKPLGRMKFSHEILDQGGVVDYFCVHKDYRKRGLATFLLDELIVLTAQKERNVHIFLKEGFPLWSLPPLYTSSYIARMKKTPGEAQEHFGPMGIGTHGYIQSYTHADFLPLTKFVANLPYELTGDSELFGFNYRGHDIFLCMTDLHHCSVPDGKRIGELSWILPKTVEVPLSIQKLAVETCVDSSKYDIVIMDHKIPHEKSNSWQKDASFSWYIFNYNPGTFFSAKPYWIF